MQPNCFTRPRFRVSELLFLCLAVACGGPEDPDPGPATSGPPPSAGHDLVYDDSLRAVLLVNAGLGGPDDARMAGRLTRLWRWNGAQWSVIDSSGPPVRNLGGVAYDSRRDKLVLHGGTFSASLSYGDTWEWDRRTGWQRFDVPGPGLRDHTQMTYDAERGLVVLFGGQASTSSFPGDTWTWDGSGWSVVATTGPAPRVHHAMAFDPVTRRVLLFGGAQSGVNDLGDTWTWNGTSWAQAAGTVAPRTHGRLAAHGRLGKMLLLGGSGSQGLPANYLVLDGSAWRTEPLSSPPPRYLTAAAYDRARDVLVLFGGGGAGDVLLADTWEFDGSTWRNIP